MHRYPKPALGRRFDIGDVYDWKTGSIRTRTEGASNQLPITENVRIESNTLIKGHEAWLKLRVSDNMKAKIDVGRMKPLGANGFLSDLKDDHVILVRQFTTRVTAIPTDYVNRDDADSIVKIEYGWQVSFVFQTCETGQGAGEIITKLFDRMKENMKSEFILTDSDIEELKGVYCRVYSDVPSFEHSALTLDQVQKVYSSVTAASTSPHGFGENETPLRFEVVSPFPNRKEPAAVVGEWMKVLKGMKFIEDALKAFAEKGYTFPLIRERITLMTSEVHEIRKQIETEMTKSDDEPDYEIPNFKEIKTYLDKVKSLVVNLLDEYEKICDVVFQNGWEIASHDECEQQVKSSSDYVITVSILNQIPDIKAVLNKAKCDVQLSEDVARLKLESANETEVLKSLAESMPERRVILTDRSEQQSEPCKVRVYKNGALIMETPITISDQSSENDIILSWERHSRIRYEVTYRRQGEDEIKTKILGDQEDFILKDVQQETVYLVKLRACDEVGNMPWEPEIAVGPLLPYCPEKPFVLQVNSDSCRLIWSKSDEMTGQDSLWQITVITCIGREEVITSNGKGGWDEFHSHLIEDLTRNVAYTFSVRLYKRVKITNGVSSDQVASLRSKPSEKTSFTLADDASEDKNRAVLRSKVARASKPYILDLHLSEVSRDPIKRLRKVSMGNRFSAAPMKTILVVGETGSGKSTLINSIINYIMGVTWEDPFRVRIIHETLNANQAVSQTRWVTAYVIYHANFFKIPYSLTIVDTPGFGDTAGIEVDEQITKQLKDFFNVPGYKGIESLDAIGFVVPASQARLTPTQKYIFASILSIFGNDTKDNIFPLITFCDGDVPPILQSLKSGEQIPHSKSFQFNNSAVFSEGTSRFNKMFWEMGEESYHDFLRHLNGLKTISLTQTKAVLDKRERLQLHLQVLNEKVDLGITKMEELNAMLNCFLDHAADIDRNKNFKITVEVRVPKQIPLNSGEHVTNCLKCNQTCHYPCILEDNDDKYNCGAMNNKGSEDANCFICPRSCHWSEHKNYPYRIDFDTESQEKTSDDVKARYEAASQETLTAAQVIHKMMEDIEALQVQTAFHTNEIRKTLEELSKIALRPDPLTTTQYIDLLIQAQKTEKKVGWKERLEHLQKIRERAEQIENIVNAGGTDAFEQIRIQMQKEYQNRFDQFDENVIVKTTWQKFKGSASAFVNFFTGSKNK